MAIFDDDDVADVAVAVVALLSMVMRIATKVVRNRKKMEKC